MEENLNGAARSNWVAVPDDLLLLEKDPLKASSDPGYYGREYLFSGDTIAETAGVLAVFRRTKGCLAIYARQNRQVAEHKSDAVEWARVVELSPILPGTGPVTIVKGELVRNAGDVIVLRVAFGRSGSAPAEALFSFDRTGIVEVKPVSNLSRVQISGSIRYGVVPGFVGDDLVYGGPERLGGAKIAVPTESVFLGLIEGENSEVVMAWPKAKQRMSLQFGENQGEAVIQSVDFDDDGQVFYLTALGAPGLWHRETLTADYLEKDVKIQWKAPFAARWKTQLFEEELKTTFTFRPFKGQIWRGVAGSYQYPVWFNDGEANFHLGKKVQPKGESVIYCLEGWDTPSSIVTPADILKQALGRQAAEGILDYEGRRLRTHHRRGGDGVRRACTCGCTEAIQAVFEAGEEVSRKEYIRGALDDMIYFVHRHMDRIDEYRKFADDVLKKTKAKSQAAPELKEFLESIGEIVQLIPQECEVQKENMRSFGYADELSKKTLALASKKDSENLKAYMALLKAWRDMGGAQDYVVAKCHTVARTVSQTAGYGCAALPAAVPVAEEIRAACRQVLRNPDGYEIWADY